MQNKDNLASLSAHDLYKWVADNMKNDIDPMEPGEWFLHMYSTHYLVDFDIPDWGELAYRAELLQTVREIQRNKNHG